MPYLLTEWIRDHARILIRLEDGKEYWIPLAAITDEPPDTWYQRASDPPQQIEDLIQERPGCSGQGGER